MITGKLYNGLKFVALVVLPAAATLYLALAGLWNLPSPEAVSGTIVAVDTFLGAILHISASNYNSDTAQGTMLIHETPDTKTFSLEFDGDPEEQLESKNRVVFKVQKANSPAHHRAAKRASARKH